MTEQEQQLAILNAEIRDAFLELCRPVRYGWRGSQLDSRQREYIIQRHELIKAIEAVQRIDMEFVNIDAGYGIDNTALMRENALHALAAMARAMTRNEREILFNSTTKTQYHKST